MSDFIDSKVVIRPAGSHIVELIWCMPPNNFINPMLVRNIAAALESLDADPDCRVMVLAPEGKHFCAGSNLAARDRARDTGEVNDLYGEAKRLFRITKPMVAAVNGSAIGGGLGLAVAADFRVVSDDVRMSANFSRLGYYPGFGLTATLPNLLGRHKAAQLFYSGRRVQAEEALAIGLADAVAPRAGLRAAAINFAMEFASSAPTSVQAIRAYMRAGLPAAVEAALAVEIAQQDVLRQTEDFREGVLATAERRPPVFKGR